MAMLVFKFLKGLRRKSIAPPPSIPQDYLQKLSKFQERANYRIKNKSLFIQAFKHRSYSSSQNEARQFSYERLEFLGDAVLELVVAEYLFAKHASFEEGDLTKLKSLLVNKNTLAAKSKKLGLGDFVMLSYGEEKSGGRKRSSILSDLVESIIGAIYLDRGYRHAREFIVAHLLSDAESIINDEDNTNYKGDLLEYAQKNKLGSPWYELVKQTGPDHNKKFTIEVYINSQKFGAGKGNTKKDAEQRAAKKALQTIRHEIKIGSGK